MGNPRIQAVCLFALGGVLLTLTSCSWLGFGGDKKVVMNTPYQSLNNLDQWVIMGSAQGWSQQDGVIRSEGGKGGNWLRSPREYGDFSLRLEYRVAPGGNSGVFIRCAEQGNPWETGHECQISNEQPPRDDMHCTGSLYGNVVVITRPDESPEVWHQYEILCKGTRIIVYVDGIKTEDVDQAQVDAIKDKPLKGFIGLQDSHTDEGKWIEFRNIQIREL
ncbi:MAG: DUF1080 domain-containing protein [bacterium]|nr:DUF1080 domain-containing protein [bacterium]